MSFSDLGLAADLVRAVTERGYTEPTPVQRQAIPAVLAGGDLLAGAQTGTGKTAGFTLPILQRLTQNGPAHPAHRAPIRALILTPTRELAAQVEESVREYGKYTNIKSMAMFGGVSINPQITALRGRIDVLVATPGRLLDHVGQNTVDLRHVEILVLDEADRMLDMGFIRDIRRILGLLPAKRQNLLFSATFSDEIKTLADTLLNQPALIEVARRHLTADSVAQKVYLVDRERKRELLTKLIRDHDWHQVLVFTRTKHGANRLVEQLGKDAISALAIHGNKSQGARTRALSEFKTGSLQVLVATDIAARGIDISELPHVVNYELPNVAEDYVHRIGRTGRAGCEGEAISLVCIDERELLGSIERLIKHALPKAIVPGFEPDPSIPPEPIPNGRNRVASGPRRSGSPASSARPPSVGAGRNGAGPRSAAANGPARSSSPPRNGASNGTYRTGATAGARGDDDFTGNRTASARPPLGEINGNVLNGAAGNRAPSAARSLPSNRSSEARRPASPPRTGNR